MKLKEKILIASMLCLVFGLAGCSTTQPPGETMLRTTLGLTTEGNKVMDTACSQYDTLLQTMTVELAQQTLIDALKNDPYVSEAFLSTDGYTIGITFTDGTAAAILTNDGLFDNKSNQTMYAFGKIFSPATTKEPTIQTIWSTTEPLQALASTPPLSCGESSQFPASKKDVIIVNAASVSDPEPSSENVERARQTLLRYGWQQENITVVQRATPTSHDVTPYDLIDYSGNGIVIFIGHGGSLCSRDNATPGHHYFQCCNAGDYSDVLTTEEWHQILEWQNDGKFVTLRYKHTDDEPWIEDTYMDVDLIRDHGRIHPGAIVYTISCNSWNAQDDFTAINTGSFMGWDGRCMATDGNDVFDRVINAMYGILVPQTDLQAFESIPDPLKTSSAGGFLRITSDDKDTYLPAWAEIIMTPTTIPPGADKFTIELSPKQGTTAFTLRNGESSNQDGLHPIETLFTIRVLDSSGMVLETGVTTYGLFCGPNTIHLREWDTYGIILSADPSQVAANGEDSSTITATVKKWKPTDSTEPTGEPLIYKCIEFDSTFGVFDTEVATTDEDGKATVHLTSTEEGLATVRAFVTDDRIEATTTCSVRFGSYKTISLTADKISLDYSPSRTTPDSTVLTAKVTDQNGNPVKDQNVYFSAAWATLTEINPIKTDASGNAQTTLELEHWTALPNPTTLTLREDKLITCSLDGTTTAAELHITTDVSDYVTMRLSGSPNHTLAWGDPNTTFEANGISIQLAINDPSAWRTVWEYSSSIAYAEHHFYAFNFSSKPQRQSTLYLFFQYHNNPTGYIRPTYLHLFNSWIHYIEEIPAFSGSATEPKGTFSMMIP